MKKRMLLLLVTACAVLLAGCSSPNSLQIDLFHGYGEQLKLLHLNASNSERETRIRSFAQVLEESEPLEKDISLFAYYPDYRLEIEENGETTAAVVDINGDYVEFYYEDAEQPVIYRSTWSALEFNALVNQL